MTPEEEPRGEKEKPDIVVVGASAGGVFALQKLVSGFSTTLNAAVLIVLHLAAEGESLLPGILSRAGPLPARLPGDGDYLEMGRVYSAPPDHHLFLVDSRMRVIRGPRENRHRPAIDVLFRSAALAYGPRVIGVLLTGSDDDGAAGMKAIKERGGIAIVQDPANAEYPDMPRSAMRVVDVDFVLPLGAIGGMVSDLVTGAVEPARRPTMSNPVDEPMGADQGLSIDVGELGTPTAYSCPECNGTLWELQDGDLLRYRCRVGHAYSAGSMVEAQSEAVERALWEAVRTLEESAAISRRIAAKSEILRNPLVEKAAEREQHAKVSRDLLVNQSG